MKESQKIARYEIIRKLGKGGMGVVYLARDPNFIERQVAVKVLSDEVTDDPRFRARFEREANTLAHLEHPAIVPVYDFGEEENQLYLVMRYMRGGSLTAYLPMPLHQVDDTLTRLAAALDKVHQKGIIHRDIKPANVLLDEDGEPYLADFGIAREVGKGTTAVGTPRYMAPEQLRGEDVDARTDVYQLGVMLFQMLTGHLPKRSPIFSVCDYDPDLPTGCDHVIARAMAEKKKDRYQSAGELAQAFRALVEGREDRTPPVGPVAPSWEEESTRPRQLRNPDDEESVNALVQSIPTSSSQDSDSQASIPPGWLGQKSLIIGVMSGIVAVVVLIAAFVAIRAWLEPDRGERLGVITGFNHPLEVKGKDHEIRVYDHLYKDDLLIAHPDTGYAEIEICCEQERLIFEIQANQNITVDCQKAAREYLKNSRPAMSCPRLSSTTENAMVALASRTRSSRSTENQKPLLISPRNSVITDTRPTFRWQPVPGASRYRITLDAPDRDNDWQVETNQTSLPYPVDLPPLPVSSKSIYIEIATLDHPKEVDTTYLYILDEQSLVELAQAEAEIRSLEVDETGQAYRLAQLYRQQEMKNAAIAQLEQITANPESVSADLWQQLGDLYFEIDLYAQAEETYQSALNAAEASANQRAQANAYVGLALTADAFNENEQALDYLNQAEALYREIGQDALAEQVVELRTEINP